MIKIVCISDTHNQLSQIKIPDGDILIHCGDWTMLGEQKEIIAFGKQLRKLTHKHKLIIPGNHDLTFDPNHPKYHPSRLKWLNMDDRTRILDTYQTIEGISFFSSSLIPPIGNPYRTWGFESSETERKEFYDNYDLSINILVTHCPPLGILDEKSHFGCRPLGNFVNKIKPKYHIFGHCHDDYGKKEINGTTFLNVSSCNLSYYPVNKPVIIEYEV